MDPIDTRSLQLVTGGFCPACPCPSCSRMPSPEKVRRTPLLNASPDFIARAAIDAGVDVPDAKTMRKWQAQQERDRRLLSGGFHSLANGGMLP